MNERLEMNLRTRYHVECVGKDGVKKWEEDFENLVVTAGLNKVLDAAFKTGLASPAWYVGLVDGATTPSYDIGDVLGTHSGWTENVDYSESGRQAFTPGTVAAGSVDNSNSRAVFTVVTGGTVAGFFLTDQATGTSGVLYGEGTFIGGARPTETGDSLRVTATISA